MRRLCSLLTLLVTVGCQCGTAAEGETTGASGGTTSGGETTTGGTGTANGPSSSSVTSTATGGTSSGTSTPSSTGSTSSTGSGASSTAAASGTTAGTSSGTSGDIASVGATSGSTAGSTTAGSTSTSSSASASSGATTFGTSIGTTGTTGTTTTGGAQTTTSGGTTGSSTSGSTGATSGSGTGGCSGYGATCGGGCCPELACDTSSDACLVAQGFTCGPFVGEYGSCANNDTCDIVTDVCEPTCSGYGASCGSGCCPELTCDTSSDACLVAQGFTCGPFVGEYGSCANNDTCDIVTDVCEPTCSGYGASCGSDCCPELTCDTSSDACLVAQGFSCGPFLGEYGSCANNGTCDIVTGVCEQTCSGYGASCGSGCCPELACDTSSGSCLVAQGFSCGPFVGEYGSCANNGTCDIVTDLCEPSCSGYGASCGSGCCPELACDTNSDACLVAQGFSCGPFVGEYGSCANNDTCDIVTALCEPTCSGYGASCGSGCCPELACDTSSGACLVALGFSCGPFVGEYGSCANNDTCDIVTGVCE